MKLKQILSFVLICLSFGSFAQKAPKANVKLISAYTRKIAPSEQTNPPMAGSFFVLRWNEASYPETMFWRGENGWLTCKIERAVKRGGAYKGGEVDIEKIKKNDILFITPLTGGRFPVPAEIPETAKNTLFYKTAGSAWIAFPVKKLSKK